MVTPSNEHADAQPALIGIDWGSSSLRAWLIGPDGAVLDERSTKEGASTLVKHEDFAAALDGVAGAWRAQYPDLPLLACGMVGSSHGWLDVPYARSPAGSLELAAGLARAPDDGPHIVPGLMFDEPGLPPDLMRGEETQIAGALHAQPALAAASCIVLPGTHSKWARVADGQVTRFATWMTGELYAVLRKASVLGRLMPEDAADDPDAFLEGVDAVRAHGELGLSHQIFAARTLGVTERMPAAALSEYLSGLLIGHELRAALAWRDEAGLAAKPLALVGEPRLCARYQEALRRFGHPAGHVLDNVAPGGLLALAQASGLLPAATP